MIKNNESLSFECVRPVETHARLIMEWRNDPDTLKMSFHTTPKQWQSFFPEFINDYFSFPDLPPLFVVLNGQPIAFLRFRPIANPENIQRRSCDISINVAPPFRNQGIGSQILTEIQPWIAQQGYDEVYAEIKQANVASKQAFLKAGFHSIPDGTKEIIETGEKILIFRLMAPLDRFKNKEDKLPFSKTVFVIAEAGSNWKVGTPDEDWEMSRSLIHAAAKAGADAIKFQVFRPETTYVANAGTSDYLSDSGIKEEITNIFANLSMPYEMIPRLAKECQSVGIRFMATPFSPADFAAIDPYVSIHKIASYELRHIRLLEMAAASKKPIIVSTGAATEDEIAWSVDFLKKHNSGPIILLQCTASYPAAPASMHLRTIAWLKQRFHLSVGLSDHSKDPFQAPIAAVALGAVVIEKHFTMDNALSGPDHAFAVMPDDLEEMVQAIHGAEKMLGSEVKIVDPSENELRFYARRGIQALSKIALGEKFQEGVNVAILRPGKQQLGVHPKFIDEIEGKAAKREILAGEGIQHDDW